MFSEDSPVYGFTLQWFPIVSHCTLSSPLPPAAKQMPQLLVLQVTQNSAAGFSEGLVGWIFDLDRADGQTLL